jgi:hypothetical protein
MNELKRRLLIAVTRAVLRERRVARVLGILGDDRRVVTRLFKIGREILLRL